MYGSIAIATRQLLGDIKTLRDHVGRAADKATWQPSLFDGIEQIDPKFIPTKARGTKRALKALREWFLQWKASLAGP